MSFRCLIMMHDGACPDALRAVADGILRPMDTAEAVKRWALEMRYRQPMRVFVAPGDYKNPQLARLRAYWQHYAAGMRYTVETLPALALDGLVERYREDNAII